MVMKSKTARKCESATNESDGDKIRATNQTKSVRQNPGDKIRATKSERQNPSDEIRATKSEQRMKL
jgi:hypothetical protein